MTDRLFETAAISLCSGPQVCSPPRSSLPQQLIAAGQPRLLRRAEHASLPPHASEAGRPTEVRRGGELGIGISRQYVKRRSSFLLRPKFQKVLDHDSAKWYIMYHDIAYNIWSPGSASSHGPRKRGDAGCMGRGDVHCRGGTSDRLPQTQPKRNNHSYANAPT